MATLFNTKISATYPSLIKTIDNAALTATLKQLTDGTGGLSGLYANTAGDFKVTSILEWGSLKDTGTGVTITQFVTAANGIANFNNDTTVPTSAAVKTYVDAVVTASDLDFLGDSNVGTPAVDLDSQNFSVLGTTNEIVTSGVNQTLTIGLPNSVTISGTYTGATFSGDLNGTINTATTATTQTAGDNSTKVATTAYVDSLDAASDLDFSGDSGTGDVTLNTQVLAITGTNNQIVTAAANQGLSLSLPATVHRDLQGNVTGNVDGDLTGNVTATSVLADGVSATTQASSDSSVKVATTAFVKGLNNASDLDFTTDSGSGAVVLNTETFSVLGTTNQINSAGSGQAVTLSLPATVHRNLLGNVTGDLTGNADTATKWETARDLSLTGQATGTISSVDGTLNVSGAVTLDNNSVTGKVLTGLPTPAASTVLPTDSILEGIGKIQSQINGLANGLQFQGSWNADTNSPNLISGGGEVDSGTTTSAATNKLIQTGQNFTTTVNVNDKVINQVDFQTAIVTNVDSDTTLSLDTDIMLSGEAYTIDTSPFITQGHYYVVNVGGATNLNGISEWSVGDWVIAGADNLWTKLDHTDVEGVGTPGNIAKWLSTGTIADSIIAESGAAITVTGTLATTSSLTSGSNFDVATDKFTANATTGNVAFPGDLAINTNKFTVNATSGNTLAAGTITSPTFLGDLNGTINTLTTAVTQSANNNSTKVATTAYVDTSAGLYLPLAGGTLTGGLTGTSATFAGIITANSSSSGDYVRMYGSSGTGKWDIYGNGANLRISDNESAGILAVDTGATFGGNVGIGTTSIPSDHKLQIHNALTYSRFALSNSTSGSASGDGLKFQLENLNAIIKNQENGYLTFGTNGRETDLKIDSSGNVDIYQTGASQLQLESLNSDANIIINSGADGVGGSNREEGFIRFYQDNADHFTLGKRNNGQFVLLDHVAGSDVITVQDNGGILLTPANNLTQITGSVGIGAVAESKLSIKGGTAVSDLFSISDNTVPTSGAEYGVMMIKTASVEFAQNITSYGTTGKGVRIYNNGGAAARTSFEVAHATGTKFIVNGDGNVGIGTDSPNIYSQPDATNILSVQATGTNKGGVIDIAGNGTGYSGVSLGNESIRRGGIYSVNGSDLAFYTNSTNSGVNLAERMRITSGGNVGIGTGSPASAFGFSKTLEIQGAANAEVNISQTANSKDWSLGITDGSNYQQTTSGQAYVWESGGTERMRILANGNLAFNATSNLNSSNFQISTNSGLGANVDVFIANTSGVPYANSATTTQLSMGFLNGVANYVATGQRLGALQFFGQASDAGYGAGAIKSVVTTGGNVVRSSHAADLTFETKAAGSLGNVERMRITGGGHILLGNTTASLTSDPGFKYIDDANIPYFGEVVNTSTGNGYSSFHHYNTNATFNGFRFYILNNGGIVNYSSNNSNLSDERVKNNIEDSGNYLNKICSIPVRLFNYKDEPKGTDKNLGVIAQEVEAIAPELVNNDGFGETPEDGIPLKTIYSNDMMYALMKAIQELKAEVDKLEQECKCK